MKKYVGIAGLVLFLYGCGGGSSSPSGSTTQPGQGNGQGQAAFVTTLQASTGQVNPGEMLLLKALTSASTPSFAWSATGGTILSQQDGLVEGKPTSIAWWRAPLGQGISSVITVTVTSPEGVVPAQLTIKTNPPGTLLSTWPTFHNDSENRGLSNPQTPVPPALQLVWKQPLLAGSRSSPAAISDGIIYVGDGNGGFFAFQADTGNLLWSATLDGEVPTSPVVADGKVFVGTVAGTLYSFDASTGAQHWSFQAGAPLLSTPAYAQGLILIATQTGILYALRGEREIPTRAERIWWQRSLLGEHIVAPLAINLPNPAFEDIRKGSVFVSTLEGNLYSIRLSDGAILWKKELQLPLTTKPVIFNWGSQRLVGVSVENGDVFLFDNETSTPFQDRFPYARLTSPATSALVHSGNSLLFTTRDNHLIGIDLDTGNVILNIDLLSIPALAQLGKNIRCTATPAVKPTGSILPNIFYTCFEIITGGTRPGFDEFFTMRGALLQVGLNPLQQPDVLAEFDTGYLQVPFLPTITPDSLVTSPAIHGGKIYFAGLDGALYALGVAPTVPPTPQSWGMKRYNTLNQAWTGPGSGPPRGLLSLVWSYPIGARVTASPIVVDNTLYIGAYDASLYAFRAHDGNFLWKFTTAEKILSTPVFSGGTLLVSSKDAQIYALNVSDNRATAKPIPLFDGSLTVTTQPVDMNGQPSGPPVTSQRSPTFTPSDDTRTLLLSSSGFVVGNLLFSFRLIGDMTELILVYPDGRRQESFDFTDAGPQFSVFPIPSVIYNEPFIDLDTTLPTSSTVYDAVNRQIYFGGRSNYNPIQDSTDPIPQIFAYESTTTAPTPPATKRIWAAPVPNSEGFFRGPPAYSPRYNLVFGATDDGYLAVVNAITGSRPIPPQRISGGVLGDVAVYENPDGSGGILFFGTDSGAFQAYNFNSDGSNLTPRWTFLTTDPIWSSPAVDPENMVIYFGGNDSNFYALDLLTGNEIWRFRGKARFISSPVITGKKVFIVDEEGTIYAFAR